MPRITLRHEYCYSATGPLVRQAPSARLDVVAQCIPMAFSSVRRWEVASILQPMAVSPLRQSLLQYQQEGHVATEIEATAVVLMDSAVLHGAGAVLRLPIALEHLLHPWLLLPREVAAVVKFSLLLMSKLVLINTTHFKAVGNKPLKISLTNSTRYLRGTVSIDRLHC